MKEFVESEGIQAAMTKHQITRRAKLQIPGGEVTYPTHITIAAQKRTLLQKTKQGDIFMGELIAPIILKATKVIRDRNYHTWEVESERNCLENMRSLE